MKQFELRGSGPADPGHPLLKGLNTQQLQAVSHTRGPLLIIAGAGSGKTRVLTYRIAYLIAQGEVSPRNVLALTFTNKAAQEMKERIHKLIGDEAKYLWMGTFHSIFGRILRIEADRIGYKTDFSIYDTDDGERAIKQIMKELNLSAQEVKPRAVRNIISNCKNQMISPELFRAEYIRSTLDDIVAEIYPLYEKRLKESNAMDFDDLIIKPIELFEKHPQALEHYQERFKHIMVDEYQDTNRAQYLVTQMLSSKYQNVCVVGDDAQSIYSFRGADISNILNFQKDYPNATKVPLEQNYRSTAFILKAADSVIKQNKNQLEKTLWTENKGGETITVLENFNDRDEANRVAKYIRTLKARRGYSDHDFAILYRTNAQSRTFEDALRRESIPYQLIGGVAFYQRKEIKDVISYLRLLINPADEEALRRIINEPARGIGDKSIETLLFQARNESTSLWEIMKKVDQYSVYGPAKARISQFIDMMQEAREMLGKKRLLEIAQWLLKESGYMQQFTDERTQDAFGRRDNVMELLNTLSYFEQNNPEPTLSNFLQEVALFSEQDNLDELNGVTMMTIHASKGLEFPVVFIVGLEEELFPSAAWGDNEVDYEEERRLFYVAITRAQKELYLSYARSRFRYGEERAMRQSRFLKEVDSSVLRNEVGASFHAQGKDIPGAYSANRTVQSARGYSIDYEDDTSLTKQNSHSGIQIEYESVDSSSFTVGTRVSHDKFGEGKVVGKEGFGDRTKVTVFFRQHGQKKLVLKFANLKIIN